MNNYYYISGVQKFRRDEILSLRNKGFKVTEITEYQYRINDTIDLYPVRGRYHNIKTQQRGSYPVTNRTL